MFMNVLEHSAVPQFAGIEPGEGLRNSLLGHGELLNHGLDLLAGREIQHSHAMRLVSSVPRSRRPAVKLTEHRATQ
jgi:hypothetical protein